ncbi:MAG: hypothetical protein IMW99_10605, partial [Firmicutes bacterium]|nr:hypothetical protein [Bacillota bacterium]
TDEAGKTRLADTDGTTPLAQIGTAETLTMTADAPEVAANAAAVHALVGGPAALARDEVADGFDQAAAGLDSPAAQDLGQRLTLAERAARAKALLVAIGQRQPAQTLDHVALGLGPADSVTQAQIHAQPHTQVQSQLHPQPHTQVPSQLHPQAHT